MRLAKTALIIVGTLDLVLAAGFFFQQAWATAFWPLPDTPLSYAFIAAILAGGAAPLIWVGLSGEIAALAGYGLSFGIMYAGMGLSALLILFAGSESSTCLVRVGDGVTGCDGWNYLHEDASLRTGWSTDTAHRDLRLYCGGAGARCCRNIADIKSSQYIALEFKP